MINDRKVVESSLIIGAKRVLTTVELEVYNTPSVEFVLHPDRRQI